jgi:hypothetical protein
MPLFFSFPLDSPEIGLSRHVVLAQVRPTTQRPRCTSRININTPIAPLSLDEINIVIAAPQYLPEARLGGELCLSRKPFHFSAKRVANDVEWP